MNFIEKAMAEAARADDSHDFKVNDTVIIQHPEYFGYRGRVIKLSENLLGKPLIDVEYSDGEGYRGVTCFYPHALQKTGEWK